MDEFNYTKKYNIQNKINKIAKKYKNKKIVLYGAGKFAQYLFENYDFSKLNIIAVADKKYENIENEFFNNIPCIEPIKIQELNPDLVLVLNLKCNDIVNYLYDFIIKQHSKTNVEWILSQNLFDHIKNKIKYGNPQKQTDKKYIFTFWEPKAKIPAYIQLCMDTWKKFLPEYEIVVLDYSNLNEWLGYEYFDNYLYKAFSLPMQADAIRIALLSKYDGIWLDADTIITSESVKKIFNIKSDVVMINNHLAFIKAEKNAELLKIWLKQIKKNIFKHKFYNCIFPFLQYLLSIKTIAKMNNWDFFGNSIINPLSKSAKKYNLTIIERTEIFALPENNYYTDGEIKRYEKYINFYFKNDFSDYVFQNTQGIILLHNSYTPANYKKMPEEEVLKQGGTLSKVLLNLIGEKNEK